MKKLTALLFTCLTVTACNEKDDKTHLPEQEPDFINHVIENPPVLPRSVDAGASFTIDFEKPSPHWDISKVSVEKANGPSLSYRSEWVECDEKNCTAVIKLPAGLQGDIYWISDFKFIDARIDRSRKSKEEGFANAENGSFHVYEGEASYNNTDILPFEFDVIEGENVDSTPIEVLGVTVDDDYLLRIELSENETVEYLRMEITLDESYKSSTYTTGAFEIVPKDRILELDLTERIFGSTESEITIQFINLFDSSNNVTVIESIKL